MSKMSRLDYAIQEIKQWFKDHIAYMVMIVIVTIAGFLIYGQAEIEKQKQDNYIYDLKAEIDSLEQTVDYLERKENESTRIYKNSHNENS